MRQRSGELLVFGAGVNGDTESVLGLRSLEALYYQSRVDLPTRDCTSMLGEGLGKKDSHHYFLNWAFWEVQHV